MNILITGASGMIGSLVLKHCLDEESVTKVIALNRKALDVKHPKYQELVVENFLDLSAHIHYLNHIDVVYYCLGAYTSQLDRGAFYRVNVDYPKTLSLLLNKLSKKPIRFCLLSGAGADRSEKSKIAFAKDKGEIENYLAKHHPEFYALRPSYIYPVTPRNEPNVMYQISRWLYPLIKLMGPNASIKSTELAKTLFKVGLYGYKHKVIENGEMRKMSSRIIQWQ